MSRQLEQALNYHRSGQWQQAELLYRQAINQDPNLPDGWHLFGLLAHQLGDHKTAIDLISQAISLAPNIADFHNSLGEAQRQNGDFESAIRSYHRCLELKPDYGEVWMNLGLAYQSNNDRPGAITAYETALKLKPSMWSTLNNLGVLYRQIGAYEKAIGVLEQAIKINPHYGNAYDNLGLVYQNQNEPDRAIVYHKKAITINANDYQAYNNLGNAYQEIQQIDKAVECFKQSLRVNSNFPDAYLNLGNALCIGRNFNEAISYYQRGLELRPDWEAALTAIGNALRELGLIQESLGYYEKAINIDSNNAIAFWNYHLMLPVIYSNESEIKFWRDRFTTGLNTIIEWNKSAPPQTALQGLGSITNFYLQYQGKNDRDLQQRFGELSVQIMEANYPHWSKHDRQNRDGPKQRIGFISMFFKEHTVAKLFRGWIQYLDRNYFDIYGYFTGKKPDRFTEEIASYCHTFHHISSSLETIIQQIMQDNLDVLVFTDIGMCPTVDRIAALRLAPIQCLAWGHPITSGLSTIDYFLSSDLMEPPEGDTHYCEKLVLLPGIGITYSFPDLPTNPKLRQNFNLSPDEIIYLSCQSLYKYLPQFDFVFPSIAQQVNRSKFVFIESLHSKEITLIFQKRLQDAFESFDLNWQDYCHFVSRLTPSDYLSLNLVSDIFLDTIEWSGGNTTLEAIACNLPIVTMPGQFMRGRHSYAMLKQMEITETIGQDLSSYINIAVRLGNDPDWRISIKQKIKQNLDLLFNDRRPTEFLSTFLQHAV